VTTSPSVPLVDVEQAYPVLTAETTRRRPTAASPDDLGPVVSAALGDVLGWRPRAGDARAFEAALSAAFGLALVEGHVVSTFRPRGFSAQADLGAVSGGQASLYARAKSARVQALELLDALVPLRTDADLDDCDAFRSLVRGAITRLVDELGAPGGPRIVVVDSTFTMLTGWQPPHPLAPITESHAASHVDPDQVGGQLGALRERFGLVDTHVNTVDEERIRTSYWTLVDLVVDLQRAWASRRSSFNPGAASGGFLGTELVLISRLLHSCAEQVDELEDVLDSVLVSASERQTLVVDGSGLTLAGLIDWLRTFLTVDGARYAQDGGRDGMLTAFTPTVVALSETVADCLGAVVRGPGAHDIVTWRTWSQEQDAGQDEELAERLLRPAAEIETDGVEVDRTVGAGAGTDLPVGGHGSLPAGMYTGRVRIATAALLQQLESLASTAARVSRYPRVVLFDVTVQALADDDDLVKVSARGINLQPSYRPAFRLTRGGPLQEVVVGTGTSDDDTVEGIFRAGTLPWHGATQAPGLAAPTRGQLRNGVVFSARSMPQLVVVDGETGREVTSPRIRRWPS
jgi:hypothetical protein